ncbi:MAG: DNA ligase (NAD(+)) LigA [Bacteroidetes bacterium GWA2_31_9b]|nr:MAG: DNA ligase (NAD(+)) LigA [Bacteroidetes bacterium GWA2_31_9b]
MDKEQIKNRINKLREKLNHHNYQYYVLAQSEISDFEYDQLLKELIDLENQNPEFFDTNSPSQRVGSDANQEFMKESHSFPMLSLDNTYSKEDLYNFEKRNKKIITEDFEYTCELKYDGASISLTYESGILVRALTRGDGEKGDNVTSNIKTIKSIPLKLRGINYPKLFEIRGEIFITHEGLKKINSERRAVGEQEFANPRNTAAGSLKLLNSTIVSSRPLDCFLYYIMGDNLPTNSHFENMKLAREWGFKIPEHVKKCKTLEQVIQFIEYWEVERKNLPYDIDGVVIKIDNLKHQKDLGITAKSPKWATAFKFKASQVSTKLLSVDYQVGRTGAITPVANLEPVQLAGTTVKRASLHNSDQIELLGIHENDTVFVEKGGEIIPKIVGVNTTLRDSNSKAIQFITHCPECGTKLERVEGEAKQYCSNIYGCPPQIKGRIEHFVSRKAMNIGGAEATIEALFDNGLIKDCADLYYLTKDQILSMDRFAEKSATNLLKSIDESKNVPFHRVLFGIGIRFVGETTAKTIAKHFHSIDILKNTNLEQLKTVDEIGERIAQSIIDFFKDDKNIQILEKLKNAGVQLQIKESDIRLTNNKLDGKIIVISGTFEKHSRDELKELIEKYGGKNASSISSNTSFLLGGANIGPSKLDEVKRRNIQIISEDDFLKMITD